MNVHQMKKWEWIRDENRWTVQQKQTEQKQKGLHKNYYSEIKKAT
jgi:hypothetical protein